MSAMKQQRQATRLKWAARVIGLAGVVLFLFFLMATFIFTEGGYTTEGQISSVTALVLAVIGLVISGWKIWPAGILLILSFMSPLGLVIYVAMKSAPNIPDLFFGLPSLVAGVLFLLSWRFSQNQDS